MLEIIVGTQGQRMDKALVEVFDRLTKNYHDNRFNVEGWKTNSHFLVNQKFIIDNVCWQDQKWYKGESKIQVSYSLEILEDLTKALCYLTGDRYEDKISLSTACRYNWKVEVNGEFVAAYHSAQEAEKKAESLITKGAKVVKEDDYKYGEFFNWTYFECRAYKKGTMHFRFKDEKIWHLFNQRVAKIKGYPLYEGGVVKPKEAKAKPAARQAAPVNTNVLMTFNFK